MKLKKPSLISICILSFVFSQAAAEEAKNWPRKIEKGGATVIIYQPQVESLTANTLESRAAVSVTSEEYTSPVFGAMWFDCQIETDRDDRTVELLNIKVSAAKFPDIDEEDVLKLSQFLESEIPNWELELSLDQLLADLEMEEVNAELAENLNNAPPEIIFATTPTKLIMVDGDPRFEQIEKSNYERVINTPYLLPGIQSRIFTTSMVPGNGMFPIISTPGSLRRKFQISWRILPRKPLRMRKLKKLLEKRGRW
ncbi:MAG: hypothetical protein P8100_15760 [bacterium]